MNMKVFPLLMFFLVPSISHASVVINEIAWMGTAVNANDEWIELYNAGDSDASLDGWTLSDGVTLLVTLAGTIGAHDYALLERTDDTTVPEVTAFQTYTGALANDGRTLTLTRSDGGTEDSVLGGTDWANIGGSNETKDTPQWNGSDWVTGTPTPGKKNVSTGTVNEDEEETSGTATEKNTTTPQQVVSTSKTGSGGGSKKKIPERKIPQELMLLVTAPRTVYVNQDVTFEAVPSGVGDTTMRSLSYTWNFGDTYIGEGKKSVHMFTHPGEYIVVVEGEFAKQRALARHEVTVLPVSFTLDMTLEGDVTIKNNAKYEVDLGGFAIGGVHTFTFPKYTILRAGGTLTVPKARVGGGQYVALYDTKHTLLTSHGISRVPASQPLSHATVLQATPYELPIKIEEKEEEKETNEAEIQSENSVVQIGTTKKEEPRGIAQFFKKIVSFFGL